MAGFEVILYGRFWVTPEDEMVQASGQALAQYVGGTIYIPSFAAIVLNRAKDRASLADEILKLRQDSEELRDILARFQDAAQFGSVEGSGVIALDLSKPEILKEYHADELADFYRALARFKKH